MPPRDPFALEGMSLCWQQTARPQEQRELEATNLKVKCIRRFILFSQSQQGNKKVCLKPTLTFKQIFFEGKEQK